MNALPLILAASLLLTLAPMTHGGTAEEPEIVDEVGDCAVPYGNAYMDLTAGWISDETEHEFVANLALAEFQAPLAEGGTGYTMQFTHQGVQWGAVASYILQGWSFATGRVTDNEVSGFNETTGSFTPGSPAVISVTFPKSLFPHTEAMDHELKEFHAFSADLRPYVPFEIAEGMGAPVAAAGTWVACDEATSDATYVFQTGEHAMGGMGDGAAGNESAHDEETGAANASTNPSGTAPPGAASDGGTGDADTRTPAPGLALGLGALGLGSALARGRRGRA